jgi:hypothetical protein
VKQQHLGLGEAPGCASLNKEWLEPAFLRNHASARALLVLGSVVTDIRNSIGGVTYSRNKGGAYSRARVAPINPRTPAQTIVRANFAANSKAWSSLLTAEQRTAWTNFAAANPLSNIFGASIIISGLAMFNKLNQTLSQVGEANITDPPADLSVDAQAAVDTVSMDSTTPTVTVNTGTQSAPNDGGYYIFGTRPLAPGRTPGNSDMRFIDFQPMVAAAVSVDITAKYLALFGTFIAGQSVGYAIGSLNGDTGAVTPAIRFNVVTT